MFLFQYIVKILMTASILFSALNAVANESPKTISEALWGEFTAAERFLGLHMDSEAEYPEVYNLFGVLYCGMTASLMITPKLFRDLSPQIFGKKSDDEILEVINRWKKKVRHKGKVIIVYKGARLGGKVFMANLKITAGITFAACSIYLGGKLIDKIITDPTSAYNTNKSFKDLVDQYGMENVLNFLEAARNPRKASREQIVQLLEDVNDLSPLEDASVDFFSSSEEEVRP